MRKVVSGMLAPLLCALCLTVDANAEPFTILPNGDLVFNTSLTTQGSFRCAPILPCTGSGTNMVTIESGDGTATLTFTGVSTTIVVGNSTIPVTLGTIEGTSTPGFMFPLAGNPFAPLLSLDFSISHLSPVAAIDSLTWNFGATLSRIQGRTDLDLPTGPNPPGYNYGPIIYSLRVFPLTLDPNGTTNIVADVGVVPEPASMLLFGTGLAGAIYARRRRQTSH